MSILTDWTEITSNTTTIWGSGSTPREIYLSPTGGMFGNGMQIINSANPELHTPIAEWSSVRFNDSIIPMDGTKVVLSGVFLVPRIGNTGTFSIVGVGLISSTINSMTSGLSGMVLLDGRNNSGASVSSTAFQIRNSSISADQVVYSSPAASGLLSSTEFYRIEMEIVTTSARTDFDVIARWYRHGTNELINTGTVTLSKPAAGVSLRPCCVTYREGWCDNVQLQIGNETYLPNLPVRSWNGTQWVRKPFKKRTGTTWDIMYPKAYKANQWLW